MVCDCHISLKYLVFQIKNLDFDRQTPDFRIKDFDKYQAFHSLNLKY